MQIDRLWLDLPQDRYRRQKAFVEIGESGQRKLRESRVVICGMGALGSMIAERLCRMGVGYLRLIDRDWVELDNLPRQALYTTQDATDVTPKAIAARERLLAINPECEVDAIVEDITHENALQRLGSVECIMDGTDNFETRYLINDVAWKLNIPWVHAGIVGASGQAMAFQPGKTSCFRCLLPEPPPIEQMQTCDSAGVVGAAVGIIASWQAMEATKILVQSALASDGCLRVFELWEGTVRKIRVPQNVGRESNSGCKTCVQNQFEFLSGVIGSHARILCGRGAVQIQSTGREPIDIQALAKRLRGLGEVFETPFLLRFNLPPFQLSVFRDGRAIIHGTENPEEARKIYARWIGG